MNFLRTLAQASVLASVLALAAPLQPAWAGEDVPATVERLAREAAEQIVEALNLLLLAIPQYEAPEIRPNGDIIIRRKHPKLPGHKPDPRTRPDRPVDADQTDT